MIYEKYANMKYKYGNRHFLLMCDKEVIEV